MGRTRREKFSTISEKEHVIRAVTVADSGNTENSRKKRKKDTEEPIYFKRV